MANSSQVPVSKLIRHGIGIDDMQEGRKTKDQYRKQKDLEEEQKLGIAPATVDVVTGRDINPHIPEFIAKHPWYVPAEGPTLQHQRPHAERQIKWSVINEWYKRGTTEERATKFRKGACENCGALTHKKKDCVERPRKIGAKWTSEEIAPDEFLQPNLTMGWDAKRDRWNGYDPQTYKQVVEEHEMLEQTRKMLRQEKMKEEMEEKQLNEQHADEDMYADDADMAGVTVDMDSRTRITVRNLRIREDTAKYLHNLDPDGPYYDPKSRSMRENPFANLPGKEKEAAKFAGENFIRYTGEVVDANEAQVFAWQARCKGIDVHALAEPTKLEAMKKEYESQKVEAKDEHKSKLLEKYGGEEYLHVPSKELLLSQSEVYVEFNRKGQVVKGDERPLIRSRYEEDRYNNNHTTVWGSYWKNGQWGYGCCRSTLKNSYCIGSEVKHDETASASPKQMVTAFKEEPIVAAIEEPIAAAIEEPIVASVNKPESSIHEVESDSSSSSESVSDRELEEERRKDLERRVREEKKREKRRGKRQRQKERKSTRTKTKHGKSKVNEKESDESSSASEDIGENAELKKAFKKLEKDRIKAEEEIKMGDRKRKYTSNYDIKAPTEAEMEAYKITRIHSSDPMANYMVEKRSKNPLS